MSWPATVGRAIQVGLKVALIAAAVLIVACTRTDEPAQSQTAIVEFVGSRSCQSCHVSEFEAWRESDHELAMQIASTATVLGNFDDVEFDYFGEKTLFLTDSNEFVVRTANTNGAIENFPIVYTFGVDPLQQYLVEFPGGRLQALPFIWDARAEDQGGQRWLHLYPDDNVAPGDILHWTGALQNWNYMCAECHSTDVVMAYSSTSDSFDTTYSEISVGCEACHGPGSIHVSQAEQDDFKNSRLGLVVDLDDQGRAVWSINPQTGIAERSEPKLRASRQPEACGRCHARRGIITDDYEYGRPLADTHRPALLDENLYFADGQILDEVYVYGSFLQSRMYRAGVTCSNCHNSHSLDLITGDDPNVVCDQCHLPSKFSTTEHTGHVGTIVGCVDCHMTSRTYMVIDERRDHSFRVPRPDLSDTTGAPNACNSCHDDKSAEWATQSIVDWHGETARPEFATALAAGRDGDANVQLVDAFDRSTTPGIARATALSLLGSSLGEAEAQAVNTGLRDPDPLVRMAALRVHRFLPPELRLRGGFELLGDEVRAVRLEAALAYADLRDELSATATQDFRRAAAEFRKSQNIILNRPEAHVSLGDFEVAFGNFDAAFNYYEQALAIEPRSAIARLNMADALRQIGDDARGKRVLEQGIRVDPTIGALHHSLGLLMVRIGERDAALAELREAARLEPDNRRFAYVLEIAESEL